MSCPPESGSGGESAGSSGAGSRTLTFRAILGPDGIERDRAIDIDAAGLITAVSAGEAPYDGFLAVPGMPNAHSHAFQRALVGRGEAVRGIASGLADGQTADGETADGRSTGAGAGGDADSFWTWRRAMYRLANAVDPEAMYAIARRAYTEMLRAGFTHVVEFHYVHHRVDGSRGPEMTEAVIRAAGDTGLPMTLLPVYYRTSGFDGAAATAGQRRFVHDSVDDFLATLEALRSARDGLEPPRGSRGSDEARTPTGRLGLGAAAHSLRAVPPDELSALVAGVDAILGPEAPLHIHVSEQVAEVEACRARFGRSPIELLFDRVEPGPRWHLVHATHATAAERRALRDAGASVVLCPLTEAYLGDGIFEAREHLRGGGVASVGSDSNVRISVIEELRMLEYGQRLRDRLRARLASEHGIGVPLWSRLGRGGARAAAAPIGAIEPGRRADLVVLDAAGPATAGHRPETAMDAWLVGGDAGDIAAVYVGGRRCVDHGVARGAADAGRDFARTVRRLWEH